MSTRVKKSRKALSCTECTRRKLKCSRTIPCTACVERGNANICRLRREHHTSVQSQPSESTGQIYGAGLSISRTSSDVESLSPIHDTDHNHDKSSRDVEAYPPSYSRQHSTFAQSQIESNTGRLIDSIGPDAPVMLEFLAQNRGQVIRLGQDEETPHNSTGATAQFTADPMFTPEQVDFILDYHEENLVWTHNVVHVPSFRQHCKSFLESRITPDVTWLAFYYAMLSVSLYHTSPDILEEVRIRNPDALAKLTYEMSVKALEHADFMAHHHLSSIQAICLLIYVGHNLGQSDRVSVLLASAIRIAQCLRMHRLGADFFETNQSTDNSVSAMEIINREVQKRVWWFLVRQDWLQIPFANTYTVHPSQFNTPMPANCHDSPSDMIKNGRLHVQASETHTAGSYTSVLNRISVLIWKTQDRMTRIGHPRNSDGGLDKLYKIVLHSDAQLKKIEREMPKFFREDVSVDSGGLPAYVKSQRRAMYLTLAHKFYSIHRHFQVLSYRNPWFAYSRISCVTTAMSSLRFLFDAPDDQYSYTTRSTWTVSSQIITAANWILFELLFAKETETCMYDRSEIQNIIDACLTALSRVQDRSRIAKNGVRLLRTLMKIDSETSNGQRGTFKMEEIIRSTMQEDGIPDPARTRVENWLPFGDSPTSFFDTMADTNLFEFDFAFSNN